MPVLIIGLIGAILPVIAAEVAKLLVGSAIEKEAAKRAWVTGFVADLAPLLDKWLPSIAKPAEGDLIIAVEAALNEALDQIEGSSSADTQNATAAPTPTATTTSPAAPVADSSGAPLTVNDSNGVPVPVKTAA